MAGLISTPRPWPPEQVPTAEQLASWVEAMTHAERVMFCVSVLNDTERSTRCFIEDHEGRLNDARA